MRCRPELARSNAILIGVGCHVGVTANADPKGNRLGAPDRLTASTRDARPPRARGVSGGCICEVLLRAEVQTASEMATPDEAYRSSVGRIFATARRTGTSPFRSLRRPE